MGERGPQPKPTALKLAAGNPGRRPVNIDEPCPPPGAPDIPEWVAADEEATAIWKRLVPPLASTGLVTQVDWPFVGRYCIKLARWIYLAKQIAETKVTSSASRGTTYPIMNEEGTKVRYVAEFPWASEWRSLDRDLRADEIRLGISASSRSRLTVPKGAKTEADQRRDFLRRA